jgi:hypothetical protein
MYNVYSNECLLTAGDCIGRRYCRGSSGIFYGGLDPACFVIPFMALTFTISLRLRLPDWLIALVESFLSTGGAARSGTIGARLDALLDDARQGLIRTRTQALRSRDGSRRYDWFY